MASIYYDGNRLINMLDINKQKPLIYMVSGNRSAGKTYWCKRFLLRKFIKNGSKFIVLVRFGYQLAGMADTFFGDLKDIDFKGHGMTEKCLVPNSIYALYYDGVPCGYTVAINNADSVKRNSTLFTDCDYMFLDEFQSETGKYCPGEVNKFISIYISVARGKGEQARYVAVLMCSNTVSLLNPYYYAMKISHRIQNDTKFLRGDRWVLEVTWNESASKQIKEGIGSVFQNQMVNYATENVYLNDSNTFIEKPSGPGYNVCVVEYEHEQYGIWAYRDIMYVTHKFDPKCRDKFSIDLDSHNPGTILLRKSDLIGKTLLRCYEQGVFRFQDLKCKEMLYQFFGFLTGGK